MKQGAWMVRRAILAVVLMVGFYAFALGIAVALLLVPYGEYQVLHRVHFKIAALCIGGAGAILWGIMPRRDRFEAPGPSLTRQKSPRLFALVDEIAAATRQPVPSEIFLLNEVNAWVTYRGGVMGFGSRRVMGIGLPLLQALSIAELKAVVAHEFGHYVSGDVSIGPWIYKTRSAIGRTIAGVKESFLEGLFLWYGRLFLRLTQAVSRRQEFIADEIAARLAGAETMMNALRRVAALAPAHSTYLSQEVLPVLRSGFLPPLATGFERFIAGQRASEWMAQLASAEEHTGETDDFDSHPCLKDRLQALQACTGGRHAVDTTSATTLLLNAEHHATSVLEFAIGADAVHQLKTIQWENVGQSVYEPSWRAIVERYGASFRATTADTAPHDLPGLIALGSNLVHRDEVNVNSEERIARAVHLLSAAVGILLVDSGWEVSTSPGEPVRVRRGGEIFDPREAVQQLAAGKMSIAEWRVLCGRFDLTGKRLAGATPSLQQGSSSVQASVRA